MRLAITITLLFTLSTAILGSGRESVAAQPKSRFTLYDNMFYKHKPDTVREGMVASNIIYEGHIWPHDQNFGVLPNRAAFENIVRDHLAGPGPLVLDIERLPLKGAKEASRNLKTLATLADWAREAAAGKAVGFYGTNTLSRVTADNMTYARELARHVDAFFPPMYTFNDDRAEWEKRARETVAEAREIGPGKPVYFYLWPQYHDGTPRAFQYVGKEYWRFQLETSYRYASGVVLWSPSRYSWDDTTGWWHATVEFMHSIR